MSAQPNLPLTFLLTGEPQLEALARLDPDRDWREFVTGERAWVLQTYLRLRALGIEARLTGELPADGICVFSSKQRRAILRLNPPHTRALLIGIREDVGEALIADLVAVQNQSQADGRRRFFVPLWSQPGLIARTATRGSQVENIAFKGFVGNLHREFQQPEWQQGLAQRGLRWFADVAPYRRSGVDTGVLNWNDFSTVDLVLAVRPPDPELYPRKPATKLYNAWLAGVPAVLGPEIAYRELRRSPLDYLEVSGPAEAYAAIDRLRTDPGLYAAMVANGKERARDFTTAAIAARWRELLFTIAPRIEADAGARRWRDRSLRMKDFARRTQRALGLWR